MIFKIIKKHNKGCGAVAAVKEKTWATPWAGCVDGRSTIFRDKNCQNRGGSIMWNVFICNSTTCGGRIAVNMEKVFTKIGAR